MCNNGPEGVRGIPGTGTAPFYAAGWQNAEKEIWELKQCITHLETLDAMALKTIGILRDRDAKLSALEDAGVDNWEGYSEAMRSLSEDGEDD